MLSAPQAVSIEHGTAGPSADPKEQTHVALKFSVKVDQLMFTPAEAIDVARKMLASVELIAPAQLKGWTIPKVDASKQAH